MSPLLRRRHNTLRVAVRRDREEAGDGAMKPCRAWYGTFALCSELPGPYDPFAEGPRPFHDLQLVMGMMHEAGDVIGPWRVGPTPPGSNCR